MEKLEPVTIKLFGKAPRYYCRACCRRVYKRNKFCPHCLVANKKMQYIDWDKIN